MQMHEAGHSKPVLWDNPEGWSGEEGGRGVQDGGTHVHLWLIHIDVWVKPPHYCKVISLQLKKKKKVLKWVAISFSRGSILDPGFKY